jgi:hypothetical protein
MREREREREIFIFDLALPWAESVLIRLLIHMLSSSNRGRLLGRSVFDLSFNQSTSLFLFSLEEAARRGAV